MIGSIGEPPPLTAINSSVESTSSVRFAKYFIIEALEINNSLWLVFDNDRIDR